MPGNQGDQMRHGHLMRQLRTMDIGQQIELACLPSVLRL
ncbi:hypothetical protein D559_0004 [Bordetella holmesii 1058]|uniref:N-acetyltransferase YedL n=1 Tax=Bordetella holmesii 1058 TaxID=1247648 RepID=A0ABP3BNU0_9BORD|nr:hypothetical protein D559_0004 [Bordetella holmesii 1058]